MRVQVSKINIFEKRAFICLVSAMFLLGCIYGYFVSMSIINTLVRGEIESDMAKISSEISELESGYISNKNTINYEFAYSLGFVDIVEKRFVSKTSVIGKGLSLGRLQN